MTAIASVRQATARFWRERIRPWTRGYDSKPDFLIIGAQKSGTTWLSHLLGQQEAILRPKIKEVHYFDHHYDLGIRWYMSNFATARQAEALQRQDSAPRLLRYEATPDYLFHPLVPARIAADLPGVKLVLALRDPVTRALSGYHHMVRKGIETRSFAEAILGESATLQAADKAGLGTYTPEMECKGYVLRGRYHEQIQRVLNHFPREALHVVIFEELSETPDRHLGELSNFLGVPLSLPPDTRPQHVGGYESEIDPEIERFIRAQTDESSGRLFEFLGRSRAW